MVIVGGAPAVALIVGHVMCSGSGCCSLTQIRASASDEIMVSRILDEVFDVEGSTEELGQATQIDIQIQRYDMLLLLLYNVLPSNCLVLFRLNSLG